MKKSYFFVSTIMAILLVPFVKENDTRHALAVETPAYADHLLAYFNDESVQRAGLPFGSWQDAPFTLQNVDVTDSSPDLKVNGGRYRTETNYLEWGRYDEASGYPSAQLVNLKNTTDPDLKKVYDDLDPTFSSLEYTREFRNAIITTDYIANIQDIAIFWSAGGSGEVYITYQLEGENEPWKILPRDDGQLHHTTFPANNNAGTGVANDILCYAAFAGEYNGEKAPAYNKAFNTTLRGKNAKIGFVFTTWSGTNNNLKVSSIMINRANGIKAFVDKVEDGTILQEHWWTFKPIVRIAGYKFLQGHANAMLNETYVGTDGVTHNYYDTFANYYTTVTSESLPYTPTVSNIEFVFEGPAAYEYDHQPHSPVVRFLANGEEVFDVTYSTHYTCNEVNIGSDVPTEIGWYALVVEVAETEKYHSSSKFSVFHIDDSTQAWLRDWNTLHSDVSGNMCLYLNNNKEPLKTIIARYDALSESQQGEINQTTDVDGGALISERIEYFRIMLANNEAQEANENHSLLSPFHGNENGLLVIVLVSISLLTVFGYYFFSLKKKHAQ